jgi:hypothetical protein
MIKKICFLFLLIGLVLFSCKKENNNQPEEQQTNAGKITPAKSTVSQLEVVIMTSENIQLNNSSYSGSIGNISVTIGKDQTGSLCFVMPELSAGSHTLSTSIEGKSYNISFNVQALSPIVNPDQLIETTFNTFTVSSAIVNSLIPISDQFMGNGSTAANFNTLNYYKQMLLDSLNAATPAEKLELAKFIAANPEIFEPFENSTQLIDSLNSKQANFNLSPEDEFIAFESGVKQRLTKSVVMVTILSMAGYSSFTIPLVGPLIGAALFYAAAKYATSVANYACAYLDKKLLPEFTSLFLDDFQKSNLEYNFNHNQQHVFKLSANYRNLGQQDMSSSSTLIKSLVTSLNNFETIWNKINFFLPNKLTGTQPHIKNITNYNTKKWRVKPAFLSIGSIDNPSVTVSTINTGNYLNATFSNASSSNQNFNFSFVYNNNLGTGNITTPLQGVVSASANSPTLTGMLHINPFNHNNCPGLFLQRKYTNVFNFIGASPIGGKIYIRTCWFDSNPGCNVWKVYNITSSLISTSNNIYSVSIPGLEYCWGTSSSILTDEFYYVSPSNVTSQTLSKVVPQ